MKSELVSVIIPVYNCEKYIVDCVDSVLMQTYDNIEIIIVNDGSTDRTGEILRERYDQNSKCILIEQSNGGVCKARNTGLEVARGEFIMFVDADDALYADSIEILHDMIFEQNADIVSGSCIRFDSNEPIPKGSRDTAPLSISVWKGKEALLKALEDCPSMYACWGKLYRRECVQMIRFCEGRKIHEDSFFVFQCLLQCLTFISATITIYKYRVTPNSASRSSFSEKYFDILFFAQEKVRLVKECFPEFIPLLPNLQIKAYLALLRNLCKTREKKYKCYEEDAVRYIIANKAHFRPAIPGDERFFKIVSKRLYWLYKIYYRARLKM